MKRLIMLALLAVAAFAADATGKWTAEVPARGGQGTRQQVFNLKQDGDKLTGTVTGMGGNENPIADGKVDGDKISFTVKTETPRGEFKMSYTGVVKGEEIQFTAMREGGNQGREFTAKKAN